MDKALGAVKLQTSDGVIFDVDIIIAQSLEPVANSLFACFHSDPEKQIIPLVNVTSRILRIILEWIKQHTENEECRVDMTEWKNEFLQNLSVEDLIELIRAVNYLNVHTLLEESCKNAASRISKMLTKTQESLTMKQVRFESSAAADIDEDSEMIAECSELAWKNCVYKKRV